MGLRLCHGGVDILRITYCIKYCINCCIPVLRILYYSEAFHIPVCGLGT